MVWNAKARRFPAVVVLAFLLAFSLAACGSSGKSPGAGGKSGGSAAGKTVAFLLPDSTTPRWTGQDAPDLKQWMQKLAPGSHVIVDVANEDPQEQLSQAQAALTQGAQVLVVVAVDEHQAAQIVRAAQRVHVPVIAYTREIANAPVKYMVGDDPHAIGVTLGKWIVGQTKQGDTIAVINGSATDSFAHAEHNGFMSVLRPLFSSGARKEVGNVWTADWDPTKAHAEMDAVLTETHGNVQAVLSGNDGMAAGIIASLQTHGLAGKVPVTGIDATLASDQLILKGLQSMTVWRPISLEAKYTAQLVVDLFNHTPPASSFFNGTVKNGLVSIPLKAVNEYVITKSNMAQLIKAGVYTKAQLCAGIPAGVGPC